MEWYGYGQTDVGCHRTNNEDTFFVDNETGIYLIADGMGGAPGGEVASGLVGSELPNFAKHTRERFPSLADPQFQRCLQEDICAVNDLIYREGLHRELEGMGSTFVMLIMHESQALIVHVGDSRCYRVCGDRLERLTNDHASTTEINLLTRVMGVEGLVQGDIKLLETGPADQFILCSDGLDHMLSDEEIEAEFRDAPEGQQVTRLIKAAKAAGGDDNITVIHVRGKARSAA